MMIRKQPWIQRVLATSLTLGLAVFLAPQAQSQTPDEETPASEDVCADEPTGAAWGLCNAYCEAMDCDSANPSADAEACAKVKANYEKHAAGPLPCEAVECPCVETWTNGIGAPDISQYEFTIAPTLITSSSNATCCVQGQCIFGQDFEVGWGANTNDVGLPYACSDGEAPPDDDSPDSGGPPAGDLTAGELAACTVYLTRLCVISP